MHDANLRRIIASTTVLDLVSLDTRQIGIQVRNDGDHIDTIGVYLDVIPPGGTTNPYGCIPANVRLIQTTVTLDPTGVSFPRVANVFADGYAGDPTPGDGRVTFSCTNQEAAAAAHATYLLLGAVDAHADDLAACPFGTIQGNGCVTALASDDPFIANNTVTRSAPRVRSLNP